MINPIKALARSEKTELHTFFSLASICSSQQSDLLITQSTIF